MAQLTQPNIKSKPVVIEVKEIRQVGDYSYCKVKSHSADSYYDDKIKDFAKLVKSDNVEWDD